MTLPTFRFGRTGRSLARVSLGTWAFGGENTNERGDSVGWSGHDDAQAKAALRRAAELGITHWDSADAYGNGRSESLIGSLWGDGVRREDIFLATKVGWYKGGFHHFYHPDLVAQQITASLTRLNTDTIDLYYLHHCDFGPDDRWLEPALSLIKQAQTAGKIRYIGLSDWSSERIMRVIDRMDGRVQPDVVQPYRNVAHDTWESSGLAGYCARHDVGVAFYSPLRLGLLLGKYTEPQHFPAGDVRNNDPGFSNPHVIHRLAENAKVLRERFGARSPEPVLGTLIAACLADAPTGTVLMGQRHPGQVEAAVRAATFTLDDDELAWVRSLYAGI